MRTREERKIDMKLKELKIKVLDKILEKGVERFFEENVIPHYKCYCCKEKAVKMIKNPYFSDPAFLCKTCFFLLIEQKDIEGFMKHLLEKNIEVFQIYPSDLADSERPYYFRFKKKEGKK